MTSKSAPKNMCQKKSSKPFNKSNNKFVKAKTNTSEQKNDFRKTKTKDNKAPVNNISYNIPKNSVNNEADVPASMRINKALASAGICSRRKAEEFIVKGKVLVNGKLITELGFQVMPEDVICVEGKEIERSCARSYLMFHKPVQTVCTASDPDGRSTIFDILPEKWRKKRLFSVGRLDYFSEGLLILTDDGDFAQRLAHPSHHLTKTYRVLVREEVTPSMLKTMQAGMTLQEGEKLSPVKVEIVRAPNEQTSTTLMEMTLSQGVNRQIRRMCRDLGLTIFKLIRIAQGSVLLGDLEAGSVRELSKADIRKLMKS